MAVGASRTALLAWQIEAGADEAIADEPVDRFAVTAPIPLPRPQPPAAARPAATSETAREIAGRATTLEALKAAFAAFDGCALKDTATSFVFADGAPGAPLMLIGEAPGAEEDRQGLPFVGPAGRLLDRMLGAIGLDRTGAYITNILPWRPPGNRNPTDSEIAACLPFIERHIELATPRILVAVGGTSVKALLNTRDGIMRLRGRWLNYSTPGMAAPIPLRAILHPAYLLRKPGEKGAAWRDMIEIRRRLAQVGSGS